MLTIQKLRYSLLEKDKNILYSQVKKQKKKEIKKIAGKSVH